MTSVGNEVVDITHLAQFVSKAPQLVIRKAPSIPIPRRRQVVSQHLLWKSGMDRVRPRPIVFQVGLSCFSPDQIGEWGHRQPPRGRHIAPAGNLIKPFRRSREIPIPEDVDPHRLGTLTSFLVGDRVGKLFPSFDVRFARRFGLHRLRNRLSVSLKTCSLSPRFPDVGQNMVHSFLCNLFDHHLKRRQLLTNVPVPFLLATSLLPQFL